MGSRKIQGAFVENFIREVTTWEDQNNRRLMDSALYRYKNINQWRKELRRFVYYNRGRISDVTFKPLKTGFDLHEAIVSRGMVRGANWKNRIFSELNCLLLDRDEHIPSSPSITQSYWILVAKYNKQLIDAWIESLPFKSKQGYPWKGTNGLEIILEIPDKFKVDDKFYLFYNDSQIKNKINVEG